MRMSELLPKYHLIYETENPAIKSAEAKISAAKRQKKQAEIGDLSKKISDKRTEIFSMGSARQT